MDAKPTRQGRSSHDLFLAPHEQNSYTSAKRKKPRAELRDIDKQADEYLRHHDPAKNGTNRDKNPSYRSERDELRNRSRQQRLEIEALRHHVESVESVQIPSPEEQLLKSNELDEYRNAIIRLFSLFPPPCHGRLILMAVLRGADWSNAHDLSAHTKLTQKEVVAAKAKIRYRMERKVSPTLSEYVEMVNRKGCRGRGVK